MQGEVRLFPTIDCGRVGGDHQIDHNGKPDMNTVEEVRLGLGVEHRILDQNQVSQTTHSVNVKRSYHTDTHI